MVSCGTGVISVCRVRETTREDAKGRDERGCDDVRDEKRVRLEYSAFTRTTSSLLLGAQQRESRSLLKDLSNSLSRLGGTFQISSCANLLRDSLSLRVLQ